MSNKPSKLKSSKDIQIGNFFISKYGTELQYIKVKTTSGNWSETYRSDSDFYKLIDDTLKNTDENTERYFHSLFALHYLVCNGIKDWQFIQDVFEANQKMVERLKSKQNELTEEENKQIIKEEKEKYENGNNKN